MLGADSRAHDSLWVVALQLAPADLHVIVGGLWGHWHLSTPGRLAVYVKWEAFSRMDRLKLIVGVEKDMPKEDLFRAKARNRHCVKISLVNYASGRQRKEIQSRTVGMDERLRGRTRRATRRASVLGVQLSR